MKICILSNEKQNSSTKWLISCQKANIDFTIVNLTSVNWFDEIESSNADIFLLKPSGETFKYKHVYDERLYVLSEVMHKFLFPSFNEVFIYENKRMLSSFLKGARIPMPSTHVFYNKKEALAFSNNTTFPIVGKTSIGASGRGVRIIKSKPELNRYIESAFNKGIKRRFGPNKNVGNVKSWSKKAIINPDFFWKKLQKYIHVYKDAQKGFVILQEYVAHDFEWRIVKIGDSWFGHQKIKAGEMASGTKGINYVSPPIELLDFCRIICEKHNFNSMAMDIFEHPQKGYVVNELQTIFGHVQDYIMSIDGKIGRYVYSENQWIFEEGNFNSNESYDLRLETAIELYKKSLNKA